MVKETASKKAISQPDLEGYYICCVVITDAVLQAKLRHMALAFLIYFISFCECFYFLSSCRAMTVYYSVFGYRVMNGCVLQSTIC